MRARGALLRLITLGPAVSRLVSCVQGFPHIYTSTVEALKGVELPLTAPPG